MTIFDDRITLQTIVDQNRSRKMKNEKLRSHVNLNEDKDIFYHVSQPAEMDRSVFWGDNIVMGKNVIAAGGHVTAHSHPEEQYSLVLSGECDVRCGDERFHLTPGGVCYAPSDVEHELWMWDESDVVIIDIFTPIREDWIDPVR